LGKNFFEDLGEDIMGAAGEILGGVVKAAGEITGLEFIEESGDAISRVTKNTGKVIGNLTDNALGIGVGVITLDKDKVEESVNGALKTTVNTANAVLDGAASAVNTGLEFIEGVVNQDGEQVQKSAKDIAKIVLVSGVAIGIFNVADGMVDLGNGETIKLENINPDNISGYYKSDDTYIDGNWNGDERPRTGGSSRREAGRTRNGGSSRVDN